jgi:hypothetical protein
VILLTKKSDEEKSQESPPFVTTICLEAKGGKAVTEYTSYSYIDISQGERVVFPATIAYPAFKDSTPAGLQQFRDSELAAFRVSTATITNLHFRSYYSIMCKSSERV